jgi:hypothetical protein
MKNINFPLELTFKIGTLSNDFTAADAEGRTVAYVRSKLFKLKEDIQVFSDESRTQVDYTIKANKWLDFSASYMFADGAGNNLGMIARKGWASIWKAHYEILDNNNKNEFTIREDNAWVKVWDALLSEVPIAGMLTGYFFNPSYSVINNATGQPVAQLKKKKSFFGRRFNIIKLQDLDEGEQARVLLGCMMMILLERRRG